METWGRGVWVDCAWWSYEVVANIHFGYVGRAAGFTELELLGGAGVFQLKDHVVDPVLGGGIHTGDRSARRTADFDDPQDRAAIRIGIDLYNQRENKWEPITHEQFRAAFLAHASQLKPGPAPNWWGQRNNLTVSYE